MREIKKIVQELCSGLILDFPLIRLNSMVNVNSLYLLTLVRRIQPYVISGIPNVHIDTLSGKRQFRVYGAHKAVFVLELKHIVSDRKRQLHFPNTDGRTDRSKAIMSRFDEGRF